MSLGKAHRGGKAIRIERGMSMHVQLDRGVILIRVIWFAALFILLFVWFLFYSPYHTY